LDRLALLDRGLAESRFVSSLFQPLAHHLENEKAYKFKNLYALQLGAF
jgi:hypothetical protein